MSASALRPLQVGEILDAGIKVYVRNARTLMGLTAVVVVPFQALSAVILLSTVANGDEIPRGNFGSIGGQSSAHSVSLGANAVITITSLLVTALTTAACVKAVSDAYLDHPTGVRISLRFALRRLLSVLWLEILTAVLLLLAFIAFVIPGIFFYAAWSVATPVLLVEAHGAWYRSDPLLSPGARPLVGHGGRADRLRADGGAARGSHRGAADRRLPDGQLDRRGGAARLARRRRQRDPDATIHRLDPHRPLLRPARSQGGLRRRAARRAAGDPALGAAPGPG